MSQQVAGRARSKNFTVTGGVIIALLVLLLALMWLWNWDWFIPVVESQASSALGRKVTIEHLQLRLGATTQLAVSGITIANPPGFTATADLATIDRLYIEAKPFAYLRRQTIVLPVIEIDHPTARVRQLPDGANNYTLHLASAGGSQKSSANPPEIGNLIIKEGAASIVMPRFKTDFDLAINTQAAALQTPGLTTGDDIVIAAHGTYSGQPVTGRFVGGALLSLRDPAHPYPVNLQIANGSTRAAVTGSIENPVTFAGANLTFSFSGQNMADLYQLTAIPIPATPPYAIAGRLDYTKRTIRFENVRGRLGASDIAGTITETTPADGSRRKIEATLASRRVDLTDLAGFLGATPGKATTPNQNAATKAQQEAAEAKPNLLPTTPINLPKINAANVELHYTGQKIINRDVPFDNVVVWLSIENGRISLHPLDFAVGTGTIASNFDLRPQGGTLHTTANIDFRHLALARIMQATHAFAGDGVIGGTAHLTGTGNSVADILGHGNGNLQLFMNQGGDVSALLIDLAGLQVGDAVLSALGVPDKTKIQCIVSDFSLTNGQVDTKTLLVATSEANILGTGTADLTDEKINFALDTQATHFSIGSLSTPINIGGTLKHPSVLPAAGPLAARAVPAIALGVLFPPLALLPTIRLGLGDKNACIDTLQALHAGHPHNPK
jgi:uncharacterized protein involved in outer membrane biogenesis